MKDQINKPVDRAIWHIEHLIRNPSITEHMRAPVHNLAWYQYFLVDVLGFLLTVLLLLVFLLYKLCTLCCSLGVSSSREKRTETSSDRKKVNSRKKKN